MLVATDVFTPVCRATARIGGIPEVRWATVPHPIGSLTDDELRARARAAVEQFVDIITNRR
jgi:hypothetical protein